MPSVKIREHESFDGAMRRFKRAAKKRVSQANYVKLNSTKNQQPNANAKSLRQLNANKNGYPKIISFSQAV